MIFWWGEKHFGGLCGFGGRRYLDLEAYLAVANLRKR